MKKYKLLVQDKYFGLEVGKVYIRTYRPAKGFMTVAKCVKTWPSEWELVDDRTEVDKLIGSYINLSEENKSLFRQKLILYEFR